MRILHKQSHFDSMASFQRSSTPTHPASLAWRLVVTLPVRCQVVLSLLWLAVSVNAFESYHDPSQNDAGYCSQCHPGFLGGRSDPLHELHAGGDDPMTVNCDLCHSGSGRDNPLTLWSSADNDNGLGCMGCHGRDYGETVGSNYRDFPIAGKHKNSGRGLRRHHASSGVMLCAFCHPDAVPYPENVMNPGLGNTLHYYFRDDVSLGQKRIDTCINEDTANDADGFGLDNDGDGLYDRNDPDCVSDDLTLQLERTTTNTLVVTWPAPGEDWTLQEIPALHGGDWANRPAPTFRLNGRWHVVIQPAEGPRYYRLIRP